MFSCKACIPADPAKDTVRFDAAALVQDLGVAQEVVGEDQERELTTWYDRFVEMAGLGDQQAIVFANQSSHMKGRPRETDLPERLSQLKLVNTNTQENPGVVKQAFEDFMAVGTVTASRNEKKRSVEQAAEQIDMLKADIGKATADAGQTG